jgi:Holliday junction resolvase-like predicted endonuclease
MISLQRNWRASSFEADLIAIDRRQVVIVEVKTRHHSLKRRFPGIRSVTNEKWKHLQKLGQRWMRNNGPLCRRFSLRSFRVDVVEVYYRPILGVFQVVEEIQWHPNFEGPSPQAKTLP